VVAADKFEDFSNLHWDIDRFRAVRVDNKSVLLGEPRFDIEKSPTTDVVLVVKKYARGKTQADANENIRKIIYNYQKTDSSITFDPWYMLGENGKWYGQRVDITLKIPEGTSVFLSEGMEEIIYDIENVSHTWDGDMVGKTWIMLPEGLTMKDSLDVKADSIK